MVFITKQHGLQGTHMKPGHVYSLSHLLIDSSMALIQLGVNCVAMLVFHAAINEQTSQNRSNNTGGSSFV